MIAFDFVVDDGRAETDSKGWRDVEWTPIPTFDEGLPHQPPRFILTVEGEDKFDWNDSDFQFPNPVPTAGDGVRESRIASYPRPRAWIHRH